MKPLLNVSALSGAIIAGAFGLFGSSFANAADIKCLCPIGMKAVLSDALPLFEKSSGHKIALVYDTAGALTQRILKGEAADVTIVSDIQNEELQKNNKIIVGSKVDLARVGVGAFVRSGATKPDISTADSLKRTLLAAKSISYGDPASRGVSGLHMAALVDRLGISGDLKAKTKLYPNSQLALEALAKGEADLVFGLTSDASVQSGVDPVGALPKELQNFTLFSAGVIVGTQQADAARAMISFLSTAGSKAIMKAKGFEPL